jgi:hypothetical protein
MADRQNNNLFIEQKVTVTKRGPDERKRAMIGPCDKRSRQQNLVTPTRTNTEPNTRGLTAHDRLVLVPPLRETQQPCKHQSKDTIVKEANGHTADKEGTTTDYGKANGSREYKDHEARIGTDRPTTVNIRAETLQLIDRLERARQEEKAKETQHGKGNLEIMPEAVYKQNKNVLKTETKTVSSTTSRCKTKSKRQRAIREDSFSMSSSHQKDQYTGQQCRVTSTDIVAEQTSDQFNIQNGRIPTERKSDMTTSDAHALTNMTADRTKKST